jgi:hypothetical protein
MSNSYTWGAGQNAYSNYGAGFSQSQMANNAYNQNQTAYQNQAAYNQAQAQAQAFAQQLQMVKSSQAKYKYMIDGKLMDFETFIDTLYPEDCPERTFLILKLKGD